MTIKRAKAHLSNGDIVELVVQTENLGNWLDTIVINGIKTRDKYIPHHSIVYILIEPEENDIVVPTLNMEDLEEGAF